jgi:hypothetical protein
LPSSNSFNLVAIATGINSNVGLFAGSTKYSPKREDMYAKLLPRDLIDERYNMV